MAKESCLQIDRKILPYLREAVEVNDLFLAFQLTLAK